MTWPCHFLMELSNGATPLACRFESNCFLTIKVNYLSFMKASMVRSSSFVFETIIWQIYSISICMKRDTVLKKVNAIANLKQIHEAEFDGMLSSSGTAARSISTWEDYEPAEWWFIIRAEREVRSMNKDWMGWSLMQWGMDYVMSQRMKKIMYRPSWKAAAGFGILCQTCGVSFP